MAIWADNRSVVCTSSLCLRFFIHCCHISLRFAGANAFSMVLILCRSYDLHGNRWKFLGRRLLMALQPLCANLWPLWCGTSANQRHVLYETYCWCWFNNMNNCVFLMLIIYYSTLRNFIFDIDWNCLQNVTTLYFLYWYHIILLEGYSMAGQLYWIHEDPAMLQGTWRSQWGCSKVDTTWSVQAISRSTWWSMCSFEGDYRHEEWCDCGKRGEAT